MSASLEGKTAIVTGAANGVGLAIARRFIMAGAKVVLSDMDEENLLEETLSLQKNGGKALAFCGDLREKLTINNLLASAIDNFNSELGYEFQVNKEIIEILFFFKEYGKKRNHTLLESQKLGV